MSESYSARYWLAERDHATSLQTTDRPEAGPLSTGTGVRDDGTVAPSVAELPAPELSVAELPAPEPALIAACHTAASCGKRLSCSRNANVSSLNIGPLTSVPSENTSG